MIKAQLHTVTNHTYEVTDIQEGSNGIHCKLLSYDPDAGDFVLVDAWFSYNSIEKIVYSK